MTIEKRAQSQDFIKEEAEFCAHNYHPVPVVVERARDCLVWDVEGREYLDMMSAYSAVSHGHLHPRLVAAAHAPTGAGGGHLARVPQHRAGAVSGKALPAGRLRAGPADEHRRRGGGNRDQGGAPVGLSASRESPTAGRNPGGARQLPRPHHHRDQLRRASLTTSAGFGPFTPGFKFFDFGDMASVRAATTPNTCAVLVEPIQGEAGIVLPPRRLLHRAARLVHRSTTSC